MISINDTSIQPSGLGNQNRCLDIRLSPAVADRLYLVRWFLFFFGVVCLLVGLVFMSLGAQPVLGFMGLEVVLLYFVYKYCERNGRQSEHVTISSDHLIIRITDRYGCVSLARFDPRWVEFRLASNAAGGGLIVTSKGRSRKFGNFLNLHEREMVLDLLKRTLR